MFTFDAFIHLDAMNRKEWAGSPEDRPLTELGVKQAAFMAKHLSNRDIHAIVSSTALRCRHSLEALSKKVGAPIRIDEGFCDTHGYRPPEGWGSSSDNGPSPLGGALAAGSAFASFSRLQREFPNGRVVLCSYGDILPALLAFVAGAYGAAMPVRNSAKGALFTVEINGEVARMVTTAPLKGFPT